MRIVGIDPGLGRCGWAIIEKSGTKATAVAYGCIETHKQDGEAKRTLILKRSLDAIIAEHQPQLAVVESLFFFKNQKTIIQIGQARGVIMLALAEAGLAVQELTPLQIKMTLTGYGKADKKQIQKMVMMVLGIKEVPKPDDVTDALATALAVNLHSFKMSQGI